LPQPRDFVFRKVRPILVYQRGDLLGQISGEAHDAMTGEFLAWSVWPDPVTEDAYTRRHIRLLPQSHGSDAKDVSWKAEPSHSATTREEDVSMKPISE
jgi:hypothetical protein